MLNKTTSGYTTSAGESTQFRRHFFITDITASEATVTVTVEWANGTVMNAVTLEDEIFNIIR